MTFSDFILTTLLSFLDAIAVFLWFVSGLGLLAFMTLILVHIALLFIPSYRAHVETVGSPPSVPPMSAVQSVRFLERGMGRLAIFFSAAGFWLLIRWLVTTG